jgi:hypothetical protein
LRSIVEPCLSDPHDQNKESLVWEIRASLGPRGCNAGKLSNESKSLTRPGELQFPPAQGGNEN